MKLDIERVDQAVLALLALAMSVGFTEQGLGESERLLKDLFGAGSG